MKLGLYIHIPFCLRKCLYCDFPSVAGREELYDSYITALGREFAGWGGVLSANAVDTVYIGGGTPTALPAALLARLGKILRDRVPIAAVKEFTVEANPGTLTPEKLAVLRESGVNRLSLGVQAFDDEVLAAAGRIHSAAEALAAVAMAADAGITNLSLDLMYGLPGQSLASFRAGLEQAAKLPVSHLSVYGLKVEEGTPFACRQAKGELPLPDEDEEEAMYELTASFLPTHGFARYEISNYAGDGAACRHNLKYWRYRPYLGLGAAAHSFWQGERLANTAAVDDYIRLALAGASPLAERERPGHLTAMAEYAFLALRTAAGLDYADFAACFGESFAALYGNRVDRLAEKGLLTAYAGGIRLTATGMKYGNVVFASFLPDKG
jgi:oxygen-independent coproporphyrinogen-3 oxidase